MPPKDIKKDDEEWEDVKEEEVKGEEEEEEEDTSINNSDVCQKYKKAGAWMNEALTELLGEVKAGQTVGALCKLGDELIAAKVQQLFKGVDKGPAFPTSISVNSCVAHNSPAVDEDAGKQVLANGDVVHVDMGLHIDGFSVHTAFTKLVSENGELPVDNKATNVINAAYTAMNTAVRAMRPGASVYQVTEVLEKVAAHFNVNPVDGVLSHQLKRYIVDGFRCIPCKNVPEHKVHDYDFEPQTVWTLDVVFTTGKGKLKERDERPYVYKVALDSQHVSKVTAAHEVNKEINQRFQTFPFAVRSLEHKKARLGLSEMMRHGVIVPYPVLYERENEVVAHFKQTLFITNKKIERLVTVPLQKGPAPAPFTDETLLAVSKMPFSLEEKKKKK